MTTTPTTKTITSDPTVRELITTATSDVSNLLSAQVELAKAEVKQSANKAVEGISMLVVAAVIAFLGVVFLLVTIAYVMVQLGLPIWAAFGIVTLVLFILAAIFAMIGKKRVKKVKGPELAKAQFEQTKQAFSKSPIEAPTSAVPAQIKH